MEEKRYQLAEKLSQLLLEKGVTVVTAESCTGGLLAETLTALPGSSAWFTHGWVAYSNEAKEKLLQIDPVLLEQYGAVSEEVAKAMAEAAVDEGAHILGVAITGFAGPTGGTVDTPVGTVWFGIKYQGNTLAISRHFDGDRHAVRQQAVCFILEKLAEMLKGIS